MLTGGWMGGWVGVCVGGGMKGDSASLFLWI